MSECMAEMAGKDSWSGLLEETRQALATLRAEDLEELAARAERMFDAAAGLESRRRQGPGIRGVERAKVAREHRLLGDLLLATDKNLQVLRRLDGRLHDGRLHEGRLHERARAGGGNERWVL
jgi:hypothetical protein